MQLTKFPSHALLQVHPEMNLMPIFSEMSELFIPTVAVTWQIENSSEKEPEPVFGWDIDNSLEKNIGEYNQKLSRIWISNIVIKQLAPVMPPESASYCKTLQFVEENYLNHLVKVSPEKIMEIMDKISSCFQVNYRKDYALVYNPEVTPKERDVKSFKLVDQFILKTHPEQKELWTTTRTKIWATSFAKERKPVASFTQDELELVKELVWVSASPEKISEQMQQFAEDVCRKMDSNEETFSLMSFAHQKLIEIHPYVECNGRIARIFMSLLGMWKGKRSLLIDDAKDYNEAARCLDPGRFTIYLQKLEGKQLELNPFMEDSLRFYFSCICEQY